jgi:hypothetical protein
MGYVRHTRRLIGKKMAQPPQFNYSIDVGSPFISALKGYELGMGIETKRQQMLGQQQLAQQQMLRQQEIDMALEKVRGPNPTAEDYRRLEILLPPEQAKSIRESLAQRTDVQNQQALRSSGRIFSAFRAGRPDIAIDFIDQEIATQRNAGNEAGAKSLETWRDVAKNSEEGVKQTQDFFGFVISEIPGGDKIIESSVKLSQEAREAAMAPERLAEQRAKALKAGVEAKFAESSAVAALNLTNAQIQNYAAQQDIARKNVEIAALNARIAQEGNVLKRRELEQKMADAQVERDDKLRKRVSDANTAFGNFDNFLNTADRALAQWGRTKDGKVDPKKPSATVRAATGPLDVMFPTVQPDVANFEELIDTIKGQAFLAQVEKMKGLGALSDKEGDALRASLTNLSLRQSPEQLAENLLEAQRLILKARDATAKKYGVGAAPDRPAGPGGAAPAQAPGAPAATPAQVPGASGQADQSIRSRADAIIRGQ